ncbi:MAG: exodeoxyribonuclease V subunit gamma [Lachnospiraceae bacterium]|nr:exodeoxyribonuclease V subunit gamma [Lachnospiraceae bacterium]
MPLQFIMGNSGSGKSHFLYQRMIEESRKHPQRNYMVIVPEQFTMQTQKDLVMMHPDKGIMNIDVLSFRRLAHRIFEEVGSDRRTVLTETGKNLMLRRVAGLQKDKLQVLGSRMNRPGYVSEVKSILSELMQYEITDFELQEMLRYVENRPLLRAKLTDIRTLYNAFVEYQRDRFMKPEELLDVLCRVAGTSELLKNSTLAFDGFAGFTPSQLNVLEELLTICPQIWMTVTIDARESFYGEIQEHELFAPSKKLIRSVTEAAQRASRRRGAEGAGLQESDEGETNMIQEPVLLGRNGLPRFRPGGELFHLEQNLFRRRRTAFSRPPEKALQNREEEISLHVSAAPAEEVHFAARTICRLVREQGYRYQEIAVITGNMSSYDHYVKKIFPMYEVPAFLDETRHILLNPCLEFIRGALLTAEKDFSYETVFRFLRTGMAGLEANEIDRLENYVLAAGIRGRGMWEREWTYLPGRMTPEELIFCNACREKAIVHILPFAEKMRQKDQALRQYADALCILLEDCQIQQQLKDREIALLQEGFREEAREYAQIYSILIALLDEMVDLLGDEKMSGQEFGEILDAGFAEASVGIIPPGIDQVQVGDIERSRLAHVKVLFFLGLNDGWVPARGEGGGIVSDMEREILQKTGIELAPSARENSYIQRFYLYQNLTKPSQRLYLSWCSSSGDGTAMRPSYLVSVIGKLFPQIPVVQEQETGTSLDQVTSRKNGLLYLTKGLQGIRAGEENPAWMELYGMYLQDSLYRSRVQELVRAAFIRGLRGQLTYQTSKELYGEVMTNSVTRLEQFAACAFAHFASYGLRLSQRELYGVKAADLGIIFHRAMELFSRRLQKDGIDWREMAQEEQNILIEECVDEVSREYGAGVLHGSAREEYTICRVKRILCRTIWALHQQLQAGSFRPSGFEVSFADAGDLEAVNVRFGKNGRIRLQGRIDRIDTAETEDTVYVKIIDYKSGTTKFDPVSLYYGLQLQLVVYLNAALEMERRLHRNKKIVPAGIFYYHLEDPVLEKEAEDSGEQTREKLLKKLRPDGVLNGDGEILRLLDRNISGDSLVIPAGLKKDGTLKVSSSAVTTQQFEQLSGFVAKKLEVMAGQILAGAIEASPFADRNHSACDYCEYSDVCGFDKRIPGMCRRREPELTRAEVWKNIAGESQENPEDRNDI